MLKLNIDRMLDITERVIKEEGALGKLFREVYEYKGYIIKIEVDVRKKKRDKKRITEWQYA